MTIVVLNYLVGPFVELTAEGSIQVGYAPLEMRLPRPAPLCSGVQPRVPRSVVRSHDSHMHPPRPFLQYWNNQYWFLHIGVGLVLLILPGKKKAPRAEGDAKDAKDAKKAS
jgi:hypothetical protein